MDKIKKEDRSAVKSSSKSNDKKNLQTDSKDRADKNEAALSIPKSGLVRQKQALSNDDDIIRQISLDKLEIAQDCAAGTITSLANERALKEMKVAFKPKTKLQRSAMWKYLGTLQSKVVIGTKLCDFGCRIC